MEWWVPLPDYDYSMESTCRQSDQCGQNTCMIHWLPTDRHSGLALVLWTPDSVGGGRQCLIYRVKAISGGRDCKPLYRRHRRRLVRLSLRLWSMVRRKLSLHSFEFWILEQVAVHPFGYWREAFGISCTWIKTWTFILMVYIERIAFRLLKTYIFYKY